MTREELKTKVEFVTDEQVKKIVYVFVTTDTTPSFSALHSPSP